MPPAIEITHAGTENSVWSGWEQLSPVLRFANYYRAPPGEGFGPRYVQEFQLLYVCNGRGTAEIGSETHEIGSGDLVFYGPNQRHQITATVDAPLDLIGIVFLFRQRDEQCLDEGAPHADTSPFPYLRGVPRCPLQPPPPTILPAGEHGLRQRCEALASLYTLQGSGRPLETRGLLWLLLQSWDDGIRNRPNTGILPPAGARIVAEARREIAANLISPPSCEQLAAAAGVSQANLNRLFKLAGAKSWHAAVETQRLLAAHRLLSEGRLNVNEAARAVGFEDQFYFSRRFKRHFGFAPSQLRRENVI